MELSLFSSVSVSSGNAKTNAKLHHKIDCVNAPSNKNRAGVFKVSYEFNTITLKPGGPYINLTLEFSLFSSVSISSGNVKTNAKLYHKIDHVNASSNKNRSGVFKASYEFNTIILKPGGLIGM